MDYEHNIDFYINKVFQDDCLNVLPHIPSQSIDMILCDLPYGTTQNKWDSVIDLGKLWTQYKRIIKENGAIVLTSQGLFTAKLILSNEDWFRYKIVWIKSKSTNFLNAKIQPLRKHECIANKITSGSQVNGWRFWKFEDKNTGKIYPLDSLRNGK